MAFEDHQDKLLEANQKMLEELLVSDITVSDKIIHLNMLVNNVSALKELK